MPTTPSQITTGRWQRRFPSLERNLWLLASAVILLNAISQLLVSGTADQDQAGELLRSQWWAWGYGSQPPLYTWIVKVVFAVTGPSLWSLQAIKVGLLSTLVAAALAMGLKLKFSPSQQLINLCGFTLIPQFLWESQRDLTHSVLAAVIATLTVLHWLELERRRTWTNYAIAGALAAAGLISKYNYSILLAGLVVASLTISSYREIVLNRKALLSLLVATLAISPHLFWAIGNPELALGSLEKLDSDQMGLVSVTTSLLNALLSATAFLGPLLIATLVLTWGKPIKRSDQPGERLLRRLPLGIALLLVGAILITGATRIKDRWYQSLLVTTPILVASLAGDQPSPKRTRIFISLAATAVVSTSLMLPGRTLLANSTGKVSRPNFPLPQLLSGLKSSGIAPQIILTSDNLIAGNARLIFPKALVLSERAIHLSPPNLNHANKADSILILISSSKFTAKQEPPSVQHLLQSFGIMENQLAIQTSAKPLHWSPRQLYVLTWSVLGPTRDKKVDGYHG